MPVKKRWAAGATETSLETDIQYVDKPVQHKGRPGDINFRSMPAHAATRAAAALEKASVKDYPPTFGRVAKAEWGKALQEWQTLGDYPFPAYSDPDQPVHLDWVTRPAEFAQLTRSQRYWSDRWASDTNYRYWKDRALAEGTDEGVTARRLFYEATRAYKDANFPVAVEKFKQGLEIWKSLLDAHKSLREDQISQKDTAFLARRYVLALRQVGIAEPPKTIPFYDLWQQTLKETIPVDPYDALEVLGRSPAQSGGKAN